MIGLVIISHANLSLELINAAELILGKLEHVLGIAVTAQMDPPQIERLLTGAINQIDQGDGVLVLTDMFGGTPNNVSLAYWEDSKVEVVTGVNLPMLIKAAGSRDKLDLDALAQEVSRAGRDSIRSTGEILGAS